MNPAFTPLASRVPEKGEMATLVDQTDWAHSPMGGKGSWPKSLQCTVDLLLSSSLPMLLLWGAEHTCIYNDAFRPLLVHTGSHPAALGQPGHQVLAEAWESAGPLIRGVYDGRSPGFQEERLVSLERNNQTEEVSWIFTYHPVKDDAGLVAGVLAICQELPITKQRSPDDVLHDQLALSLEACDLGTWDLDPHTMRFRCNEITKRIFGLTGITDMNLQAAVDVIEPGDRDKIHQAILQAMDIRSGGRYHVEYTIILPGSNERRVVRAKGKVFFNEYKEAQKFTGTIQDITEEAASLGNREKLLQLVENSNDYMSMATLNGSMTYMNPAGRELVGLSPSEDISVMDLKDFYGEAQFAVIRQEVIPMLNRSGRWSGVVHIRHRKTGEEIPCYGNYILVRDPATGKVISRAVTFRDLRPDIKARKELEASEIRFRNLVQLAPVATAIYVGREMRIQWANDAMIRLWGKEDGVVGKTIREALPELENQPFHGQLEQVFTTGELYLATEDKAELVVDGKLQTYYFNFSYKPLRDAEGHIYGVLNMAIDVTEMVLNKRKVQESESAFRNLIMKAPVGICLLHGADFVVDIANDQYVRLVGKDPAELLKRPIWEALPEAKAQGFDRLLEEVRTSGKPYFGNEQAIELVRNGVRETVYINFVYEPLFNEQGRVYSILVIAIDISLQVRLRQQIESVEERARIAVASGNLGTYEIRLPEGTVIASARFNELFGIDAEADQQDYVSKIHPDDLPVRQQAYERSLVTGLIQYECRIRKEGAEIWVLIHGSLHYDEGGKPVKIIGIVQDITEQKNSEQQLEVRVQERTAELTRLNEELQQFIFITSHDLKEPLRKIQLFSSLAKDQAGDENQKLQISLDKVVLATGRMTSLLNDLIHYSSLSDPHQLVGPVDLNEVVQTVLEDLELMIRDKEAVIHTGHLPEMVGIPFQITQLFYNLVQNALKFSRPGIPPRIRIGASAVSGEAKRAAGLPAEDPFFQVRVEDNGIGFDPKYAGQIFTVFQRLHGPDEHEGNGIGLAICKKVVANHNGRIEVCSVEGEGTVFSMIFPHKH